VPIFSSDVGVTGETGKAQAGRAAALADLARILLDCSDAEAVAHVTVAVISEVVRSPRVVIVELSPDGSVVVLAAVGLETEHRAWLERHARISSAEVAEAVPGRFRFFDALTLRSDSGDHAAGRFEVFPLPGDDAVAVTLLAVDMSGVEAGAERFVEAAVDLLSVARSRQQLEAQLRSSEARWRSLVEESPDGMAELDASGTVVMANATFTRLTGLDSSRLVGMQLQELLTVTASGVTGELETRLSSGGSERVLELRLTRMGDRSLATLRDVTSARRNARREHVLSETARQSEVSPGLLFARLVRAVEDERARMASEIHDGPVQRLSGLTLRIETVRDLLVADRTSQAEQVLGSIREQLADEVSSLRRFMVDLRPPALDRLGLRDALIQQGRRFETETGVGFELTSHGTTRLAAARELVIYRIVQEALLNVGKHACATKVDVVLDIESSHRGVLDIRDDGVGFDPGAVDGRLLGHLGLVSMKERAEMVGAEFELRSQAGYGTSIRVRFGARAVEGSNDPASGEMVG